VDRSEFFPKNPPQLGFVAERLDCRFRIFTTIVGATRFVRHRQLPNSGAAEQIDARLAHPGGAFRRIRRTLQLRSANRRQSSCMAICILQLID
jgi:hypothetical protein